MVTKLEDFVESLHVHAEKSGPRHVLKLSIGRDWI